MTETTTSRLTQARKMFQPALHGTVSAAASLRSRFERRRQNREIEKRLRRSRRKSDAYPLDWDDDRKPLIAEETETGDEFQPLFAQQ